MMGPEKSQGTMENYVVISFVGEGSFGRVFKAKVKETDAVVALKVIRKVGNLPNIFRVGT